MYDLKKIYWPDVADRKRPIDFALRLTDHKRESSFFNTSPSLSPNGDKLAFISDRDDYRSVYIMDVSNTKKVRKVIQGEENVDFEELHLLTPSIAWSPDSRLISLAVKSYSTTVPRLDLRPAFLRRQAAKRLPRGKSRSSNFGLVGPA